MQLIGKIKVDLFFSEYFDNLYGISLLNIYLFVLGVSYLSSFFVMYGMECDYFCKYLINAGF